MVGQRQVSEDASNCLDISLRSVIDLSLSSEVPYSLASQPVLASLLPCVLRAGSVPLGFLVSYLGLHIAYVLRRRSGYIG